MNLKTTILTAGFGAAALILANGALAQPSEEQQALFQENFSEADANDDMALDRQEFEAFIRANADDKLGNATRVVRMGLFDRAFSRLDADKDGLITIGEIQEQAN